MIYKKTYERLCKTFADELNNALPKVRINFFDNIKNSKLKDEICKDLDLPYDSNKEFSTYSRDIIMMSAYALQEKIQELESILNNTVISKKEHGRKQ